MESLEQNKTSERLAVDYEVIDRIYEELSSLNVRLDLNPLQHRPSTLNEKFATAKNFRTLCEKTHIRIAAVLARWHRQLRRVEAEFHVTRADLLVNDPVVKAGKSSDIRDAMILLKTRNLQEELDYYKQGILEYEMLLGVIKSRKSDLNDTLQRLHDQTRLLFEEIRSFGGAWLDQPLTDTFEEGSMSRSDALQAYMDSVD